MMFSRNSKYEPQLWVYTIAFTKSHFATQMQAPTHLIYHEGFKTLAKIQNLILNFGINARFSHTRLSTFPLKLDAQ